MEGIIAKHGYKIVRKITNVVYLVSSKKRLYIVKIEEFRPKHFEFLDSLYTTPAGQFLALPTKIHMLDDGSCLTILPYCGENICGQKLSKNESKSVINMITILEKQGLFYPDLSCENITHQDGKYYLIDTEALIIDDGMYDETMYDILFGLCGNILYVPPSLLSKPVVDILWDQIENNRIFRDLIKNKPKTFKEYHSDARVDLLWKQWKSICDASYKPIRTHHNSFKGQLYRKINLSK